MIPDQRTGVDTAYRYEVPANTFNDTDNDPLTYSATQADNSALPTWLTFTAATRIFSGTPQTADAGMVSVKVTANDGAGGSVSDTFRHHGSHRVRARPLYRELRHGHRPPVKGARGCGPLVPSHPQDESVRAARRQSAAAGADPVGGDAHGHRDGGGLRERADHRDVRGGREPDGLQPPRDPGPDGRRPARACGWTSERCLRASPRATGTVRNDRVRGRASARDDGVVRGRGVHGHRGRCSGAGIDPPEHPVEIEPAEVELLLEYGGGATAADHGSIQTVVRFPVGTQTQTITVAATDDMDDDDGESVSLRFVDDPNRRVTPFEDIPARVRSRTTTGPRR